MRGPSLIGLATVCCERVLACICTALAKVCCCARVLACIWTHPRAARSAMAQKQLDEYLGREVAMKLWLEQLLGMTLENDYWPQLSDGIILCDAMLEVKERSIPLVARPEEDGQQIAFFKAKKNIQFFLAACEEELFIPKYGKPCMTQCCNCLSTAALFLVSHISPHPPRSPSSLEVLIAWAGGNCSRYSTWGTCATP